MFRTMTAVLMLSVALLSTGSVGCSNNRAPILVGQSGLAVAQSIGQISDAAAQLQKASILPAAAALSVQTALLNVNTQMKPLPDILRTIDNAQQAGEAAQGDVDKAIAILQVVGADLSTLLAGVPIDATTKVFIELVRQAQTTVQTVLVEVARLKA